MATNQYSRKTKIDTVYELIIGVDKLLKDNRPKDSYGYPTDMKVINLKYHKLIWDGFSNFKIKNKTGLIPTKDYYRSYQIIEIDQSPTSIEDKKQITYQKLKQTINSNGEYERLKWSLEEALLSCI